MSNPEIPVSEAEEDEDEIEETFEVDPVEYEGQEEDEEEDSETQVKFDETSSAAEGQEEDDQYLEDEGDDEEAEEVTVEEEDDDDDGPVAGIEFLKQPPQSMDDFMEHDDFEEVEEDSEIDVLRLNLATKDEARPIAEYIVGLIEEDLFEYVERTGTVFPPPLTKHQKKRLLLGLKDDDSTDSFNSEGSDVLPGEPSRIRMFYNKGVSAYPDASLANLLEDDKKHKETQVNLHRTKKKPDVRKITKYTQTLEMTFVTGDTALTLYKQYYPQLEDYKPRELPSRQVSEDFAIEQAMEADPNIDNRRKGPQIISLSNKKQLLQPLMDDYYKDEKFWTGSRFIGEYKKRQFHKGVYTHPTGTKIESEFKNGHFHSDKHFGVVTYPRGDTFEGEWVKGRYQNGQITFCDGLKFAGTNWKYCEPPDRRFKVEGYYGLKPAGLTLFSDQCPAPRVPSGMYDVGDGFYDPDTADVRGYDGYLLRQATIKERIWIEKNCRKMPDAMEHVAPPFLPERIPCSYAECQLRLPLTKKRYH